ncbi:MAG: hypothetical protein ACRCZF_03695 [Gemmataceae bacterium]
MVPRDQRRLHRPGELWYQPAVRRAQEPDPPDNDGPDPTQFLLALGVVSLMIGPLGIPVWAIASGMLKRIASGQLEPSSEANIRAARVLGIVATCMFLVKLAALIPIYVLAND